MKVDCTEKLHLAKKATVERKAGVELRVVFLSAATIERETKP